jgi:glyoxylase-like metal-dependent hydrolase (beta-lactamase superfamily II)
VLTSLHRGRYDADVTTLWTEVGDRVFVRRYRFYDQDITAVLGGGAALIVDTRSTLVQAREILDDLRELGSPRVGIVVNTHGHGDHSFGNAAFRPAVIWGHERCVTMIRTTGEAQRASAAEEVPDIAADLAEVVLDPPDRTIIDRGVLDLDGREVLLTYLGRGHTDNDIVVTIPDADVLCAGDLVENGAPPWFGDGFPMDWPATAEALLGLVGDRTVVVPGHGAHADRAFVERSLSEIRAIADLALTVERGEASLDDAVAAAPYPEAAARESIERALAQLRGELPA